MGYPDFPISETINPKSYIPAADMLKFLNLYAETFNVKDIICFEHYVILVRPFGDSQWEITVKDLPKSEVKTLIFDSVFVCNGHYHSPTYPNYPGHQTFRGKQIHSHDYRCAKPYTNENVLGKFRFPLKSM